MNEKYDLQKLAQSTREKLEAHLKLTGKSICTDFLNPEQEFPNGCCKSASMILGLIMEESLKMRNVKYVWGTCPKLGTHGWIEFDSMLLDITIDQFNFAKKILVVEKEKSIFHVNFKSQGRFPINVRENHSIRTIYNEIKSEILSKVKAPTYR